MPKKKIIVDKFCRYCNEWLDPFWYDSRQRYCDRSCMNARWYRDNQEYHRRLYRQEQKRWRKSATGKRAGTPIHVWINYPKEFQ